MFIVRLVYCMMLVGRGDEELNIGTDFHAKKHIVALYIVIISQW